MNREDFINSLALSAQPFCTWCNETVGELVVVPQGSDFLEVLSQNADALDVHHKTMHRRGSAWRA